MTYEEKKNLITGMTSENFQETGLELLKVLEEDDNTLTSLTMAASQKDEKIRSLQDTNQKLYLKSITEVVEEEETTEKLNPIEQYLKELRER